MNPFWNNAYDEVKDRRYARLFFSTLLMVAGTALLLAVLRVNLSSDDMQVVCAVSLPIVILIAIAMTVRWIRLERKYRKERLNYDALSRDELAKARLKLKGQIRPARFKTQPKSTRRAAPRASDTYLKY
jgi:hypothetical protein